MNYALPLLAALLSAALSPASRAAELTVSYADVVEPENEVKALMDRIRLAIMSAQVRDYSAFDVFFAPRVAVFQRGLDPLQPWNPGEPITREPIPALADILVEQEPIEDGQPKPDYREDVLRTFLRIVWARAPLGSLKETPGAVCAPAAYDYDRKAALAFAGKFGLDLYSLRFFPQNVFLASRPGGKQGARVPAYTLMKFDYDPKAPAGWGRYETAGGVRGYMEDRDDTLGLSQDHLCFARIDGEYRIIAVFGYGF